MRRIFNRLFFYCS